VGFDANYSVRDLFFPRVGDANQTMGNVCRTGFFIDGKFAWVEEAGWERQLAYAEDSLVTAVTLKNSRLGITVKFEDFVDLARNWFIRNIEVSSDTGFNIGRAFFHYDWYIEGSDLGNTVAYDPRHKAIIAYKANRYFLVGGDAGPGFGIDSAGKKPDRARLRRLHCRVQPGASGGGRPLQPDALGLHGHASQRGDFVRPGADHRQRA